MSNTPYSMPFEALFDPDQAQQFIIRTLLGAIHTAELVQVQAVQPVADRVGFVTVQPLVLDIDTNNIVVAQSPAYNVPYLRVQGGVSAILLDPAVGDIGLAVYAQRDITNIKSSLAEGPAATLRTYSTADGLYLGGFLNGAPTQYVQFLANAAGINIVSPGNIELQAAGNISLQAGGALGLTSTSDTTVNAAALIINAPVTFNASVNGAATGAGAYTFAAPITAPDFIVETIGSVKDHVHPVTTAPGETGTMTG